MHHARVAMHVGIANLRWREKRSRHSRRMRNPQFTVSGKRPMQNFRFAHKISWPVASSVLKYIQTDKTNTLGPGQNGCHVADYISNLIFLYENCCILMYISLIFFVLDGPIKNTPTLVQTMTWHRTATRHYLNQRLSSLLTHISVTWPRWLKTTPVFA